MLQLNKNLVYSSSFPSETTEPSAVTLMFSVLRPFFDDDTLMVISEPVPVGKQSAVVIEPEVKK
jgi:hypothetical protein